MGLHGVGHDWSDLAAAAAAAAAPSILLKLFQKISETGKLPNSVYKATHHPINQNQTKMPEKRKYRPISLKNIDAKILHKTFANRNQQHIKSIIQYDQVGFILETQGFFNICKLMSVIHHISKLKDENHMVISIYDKNYPQSRHSWDIFQHNKSYIWKIHSKYYHHWWKFESISSKTRVATLTTIIQYSFGSPSHSN